jgi:hypothetical protein
MANKDVLRGVVLENGKPVINTDHVKPVAGIVAVLCGATGGSVGYLLLENLIRTNEVNTGLLGIGAIIALISLGGFVRTKVRIDREKG